MSCMKRLIACTATIGLAITLTACDKTDKSDQDTSCDWIPMTQTIPNGTGGFRTTTTLHPICHD